MEDIITEFKHYLENNRLPLLIALVGAMFHIFFTKSTFKVAVLKFVSAFLGALMIAPALQEYFGFSIKLNNLAVLVVSLATYYLLKALVKIFNDFSHDPKDYFFDVWAKIRNNKKNTNTNTNDYDSNDY